MVCLELEKDKEKIVWGKENSRIFGSFQHLVVMEKAEGLIKLNLG
jgi:hypothetical protein